MLRSVFVCLVALGLLLAGVAHVDAQQKRRGKRKAAPAPNAQSAQSGQSGRPGQSGQSGNPDQLTRDVPSGQAADERVVTQEQADAGPTREAPAEEAGKGGPASQEPAARPQLDADAEPTEGANDAELAALRQELSAVMDELVQARALVSTLGKALFKTRVRIMLEDGATPEQQVARIAIFLDGAPVFRGDGSSIPADPAHAVFEGFAAPGPHELSLEVEHRARDDEEYRYTLRNTFRFEVVRGHRTDLRVVLDDDSDMAQDFADDREGEYAVESRLEVQAEPLQD